MAEWHLSGQYAQQRPQQPAAGGGAGGAPEWYSSGGTYAASSSSYSYEAPGVGGRGAGGAAYGSFEEEAPLLEGGAVQRGWHCAE